MCFSATASFTAGTGLTLIGVATFRMAPRKSDKLFASIPLLFGIQQLTEGMIWLSLPASAFLSALIVFYLLFSHVIWPTLLPLSVSLMEKNRWRRNVLRVCTGVGLIVSVYFLHYLFTEHVTATIVNKCIVYNSPHFFRTFLLSPYTLATCASCLFSSHRIVNLFGVVAFLSALVAMYFFQQSFVSVWCFFGAILSVIIYAHFYRERRG